MTAGTICSARRCSSSASHTMSQKAVNSPQPVTMDATCDPMKYTDSGMVAVELTMKSSKKTSATSKK